MRKLRLALASFMALSALALARAKWKPTTSRLVLGYMADEDIVLIFTDPDHATAWRQEPYYSRIKKWAISEKGYVLIWEGERARALDAIPSSKYPS